MSARNAPHVLLFVPEGFEYLEAVAILDVCGWSQYREHIPTIRVTTTGFRKEVHGRFGLTIKPTIDFAQVRAEDYAAVALPGGFRSHGFDEVYDDRMYDLLRAIHCQGGTIATMCVGILPVAKAGLLKGKRATCYPHSRHDNLAQLRECGAVVVNEPLVIDDRIVSCAGPAQAIDVAMLLVKSLIGPDAEAEVKGQELFRHEGFFSREEILGKWKELNFEFQVNTEPDA